MSTHNVRHSESYLVSVPLVQNKRLFVVKVFTFTLGTYFYENDT